MRQSISIIMKFFICFCFFTLLPPIANAQPELIQKEPPEYAAAQTFFSKYIELGDAYDPELANLYSDSAKIHTLRRYPQGFERSLELSGKQWKTIMIPAMPLAKIQGDRSIFSDIEISVTDTHTKVKATRYSVRKCYIDTGYYMLLQKQINGDYLIVEEYMETQPQSICSPTS